MGFEGGREYGEGFVFLDTAMGKENHAQGGGHNVIMLMVCVWLFVHF